MILSRARKAFTGIVAIAAIGMSVVGRQQQSGGYAGPVERITLAGYAGETGALVYVAEVLRHNRCYNGAEKLDSATHESIKLRNRVSGLELL